MKIKLMMLALCPILILATVSCSTVKPGPVSGSMGVNVSDTSVSFYYTTAFNKNKKQEIILAFWDNNSEYPSESSTESGGDSITYFECRLTKSYPTVKLKCVGKIDLKSGKGKVNINGEKFDVSNGRLFLVNTKVKPLKVIQVNEQFNLPPFKDLSCLDASLYDKKIFNPMSFALCEKKFEYLARNNKIVAAFLADSRKSSEKNKSKNLKKKD
jgi:hypothetical protein